MTEINDQGAYSTAAGHTAVVEGWDEAKKTAYGYILVPAGNVRFTLNGPEQDYTQVSAAWDADTGEIKSYHPLIEGENNDVVKECIHDE